MTPPTPTGASTPAQRLDFAARLFGYDVFISFALGAGPRGSQSYASDLARRLRERDFKVFYSEVEATPGEQLDQTLSKALRGSRALVVIANRGTLAAPRWVRTEVETFSALTPARPVVPINIGGALQDAELAASVSAWLPYQGRIWIDESQAAADHGLASDAVVDRLALVPTRVRSNVKWRWLVRATGVALVLLAVGMGIAAKVASDNAARARAELARLVALRSSSEAQEMVAGLRAGGHQRALQQMLAAHAIDGDALEVRSAMLSLVLDLQRELKVRDTGSVLRAAAISPADGGAQLTTGSQDGRVQRWNTRTLQPSGPPLVGPNNEVMAVAYSPDGQRIAAGDLDGKVWVWDARSGRAAPTPAPLTEAQAALRGFVGPIRSLAFMPDGKRIVTASVNTRIDFWDAATGAPLGGPVQDPDAGFDLMLSMAVSPDGQRIVATGDGYAELWTQRGRGWNGTLLQGPGDSANAPINVNAAVFSADGQQLAAGSADGLIWLLNGATGRASGEPLRNRVGVTSLRFSRDGTQLLAGGERGSLVLWDLRQRRVVSEWLKSQDGAVTSLDLSADGSLAVSTGVDGLLRLWNADPRGGWPDEQAAAAVQPAAPPRCTDQPPSARTAWAGDCSWQAIGGADGQLRLSPRDGSPGATVAGHDIGAARDVNAKEPRTRIAAVTISSDGRHIVSGSQNGSIQRWLTAPLRVDGPALVGHGSGVASVALSADARTIVSMDGNRQVRLWDMASGRPIGPALADGDDLPDAARSVAFSGDGRSVVVQDDDGRLLKSWPAPAVWPERLCRTLTQPMSPAQWGQWLSAEVPYRPQCEGPTP